MALKGKRRVRDMVPNNQQRILQFLKPIKGLSSVNGEDKSYEGGGGGDAKNVNMDDKTRKRKPSGVFGTPGKKTKREFLPK